MVIILSPLYYVMKMGISFLFTAEDVFSFFWYNELSEKIKKKKNNELSEKVLEWHQQDGGRGAFYCHLPAERSILTATYRQVYFHGTPAEKFQHAIGEKKNPQTDKLKRFKTSFTSPVSHLPQGSTAQWKERLPATLPSLWFSHRGKWEYRE